MKKNHWLILAIISMVASLPLGTSYAVAQENMDHQHMQHHQVSQQIKVGKTGEMSFAQETKIGDLLLPAGEYRFVHRVQGEDHFVHFTQVKNNRDFGEVKCQLEPLVQKADHTAVYVNTEGGARRIMRIEVAGENVAHVF
jgi:hypothetical protein